MEENGACRYEIDAGDMIVDVDDAWLDFARRNGAAGLTRERTIGRSAHVFIAGWALSELYAQLFIALRRDCRKAELPFRCDAPDMQRHMQLEMSAGPDGHIRLAGRLLRSVPRRRIPLLDAGVRRNGQWLIICSVCRRLPAVDGSWQEVEQALASPYAEPPEGLPQLTHDICQSCEMAFRQLIANG